MLAASIEGEESREVRVVGFSAVRRKAAVLVIGIAGCSAATPPPMPDSGSPSLGCTIGAAQVAAGATLPGNPCQVCNPAQSQGDWSPVPDLTACADASGSGTYCSGGVCLAVCGIAGMAIPSGAPNPSDPCQICSPGTSLNTWSQVAGCPADGGAIDAGDAGPDGGADGGSDAADAGPQPSQDGGQDGGPDAGPIFPGCVIGGAEIDAGTLAPGNDCQSCQPQASSAGYSKLPDGTPCATNGGDVCNQGSCFDGCYIAGAFAAPHTFESATVDVCCNPGLSATAWTPGFTPLPALALGGVTAIIGGSLLPGAPSSLVFATSAGIEVLLGQPDGGFAAQTVSGAQGTVTALGLADMNGDGLVDIIALASDVPELFTQRLTQQPSGGWVAGGSWPPIPDASGLWAETTADAGGVVVGLSPNVKIGGYPPVQYSDLYGDSDHAGTLMSAATQTCKDPAPRLVFGSFLFPGAPEAILPCSTPSEFYAYVPQYSPGSWNSLSSSLIVPFGNAIAAGDLNGDGRTDLVVVQLPTLSTYLSWGLGGFPGAAIATLPTGESADDMALSTTRGDAGLQILIADSANGVVELYSSPFPYDGGAPLVATYPASAPSKLFVGDFNGDGRPDVALWNGAAVQVLQRQCP